MKRITKIGKTGSVSIDTTKLENLLLAIGQKYVARVGILGLSSSKRVSQREGESHKDYKKRARQFMKSEKSAFDSQTNADIGLEHEKGVKSKNLPRRSWLQEPLEDHLSIYFKKLGKKALTKMMESQYEVAYKDLGIVAEIIIQKGFESGGYGKWKPLKPQTIREKGSDAILIDTAQLRRSITSDVVRK